MAEGDHRRVGLGQAELLEELAHLRVGLHIEPGEQGPVLGQEVAHAKGVRGIAGPDHPETHEVSGLAQELAPGDERLQDDVAQHGALIERRPERVARDLRRLALAPGHGADDRGAPGEVGDVTGEFPLPVDRDRLRLLAGMIEDLDLPGLDDEELEVPVADRDEDLPVPKRPRHGARARLELPNLRVRQGGEGDGLERLLGHGVKPYCRTNRSPGACAMACRTRRHPSQRRSARGPWR